MNSLLCILLSMTAAFTPRRIGLAPPQRRVAVGAVAPSQSARLGHYVPSNPKAMGQNWYNTPVNIDATNVPVLAQIAKCD